MNSNNNDLFAEVLNDFFTSLEIEKNKAFAAFDRLENQNRHILQEMRSMKEENKKLHNKLDQLMKQKSLMSFQKTSESDQRNKKTKGADGDDNNISDDFLASLNFLCNDTLSRILRFTGESYAIAGLIIGTYVFGHGPLSMIRKRYGGGWDFYSEKTDAVVHNNSENLDDSPENEESQGGRLKAIKETTPMEMVAWVVALSAFGSSLAAIIVEQSYMVLAAGILSMVTGPYAYYQQTRLTDTKALKATHATFLKEFNNLKKEKDRLEKSEKELGSTVSVLEEKKFALQTISEIEGKNVSLLSEQVEDNKKILDRMQGSLKAAVLNNMLSIIIRCDKDADGIFDDDEINNLIHRMENIHNIEIHDEKFREAIVKNGEDGRALRNVMRLVKKLFSDENSNDIIAFKE